MCLAPRMEEFPLTRTQSALSLRRRSRSQSIEPPMHPLIRAYSISDIADQLKAVYKAPSRPYWPYRCYRDNYLFDNYHFDNYYYVSPHYYSPPAHRYSYVPRSSYAYTYKHSSRYSQPDPFVSGGTSYLSNPNRWSGLLPYSSTDRYFSTPSYWYRSYRDWRSAIGYKNNYASEYYTRRYRPMGRWLY